MDMIESITSRGVGVMFRVIQLGKRMRTTFSYTPQNPIVVLCVNRQI